MIKNLKRTYVSLSPREEEALACLLLKKSAETPGVYLTNSDIIRMSILNLYEVEINRGGEST